MVQGERVACRAHLHPRSRVPNGLTLFRAASCTTTFVSSCGSDRWVLEECGSISSHAQKMKTIARPSPSPPPSSFLLVRSDHYSFCSVSLRSFSLFPRRPLSSSWRNEKPHLRSCSLEPNPAVIREGPTKRKIALEITESITIRTKINRNLVLHRYVL